MAILSHLCDQDPRVSTFIFREVLHIRECFFVLLLSLLASFLGCLFAVGSSDDGIFCDVSAVYLFEGVADLSNSCSVLGSFNRKFQEISVTGFCCLGKCFQASLACLLVSSLLRFVDSVDLLLPDFLVVNLQDIEVLFFAFEAILVHPDNDLCAGVDLCLPASSTLFDSHLWHARLDSLGHSSPC